MSNSYLKHLDQMSTVKTFQRKKNYFKYNLGFALCSPGKNFSVLELGPGLGESIKYLNERGIKSIDIVDYDEKVINYVKKTCKIRNSFKSADVSRLAGKLKKYDLIILIQVLEHIPKDIHTKVINYLFSHLKKDGHFVIVVPNAGNPLGIVERYADLQHTTSFTTQSLKDLVDNSGIKNYQFDVKGYEIPPFDLINKVRIFMQKILHAFLFAVLAINGGVYFKIMTPNILLDLERKS